MSTHAIFAAICIYSFIVNLWIPHHLHTEGNLLDLKKYKIEINCHNILQTFIFGFGLSICPIYLSIYCARVGHSELFRKVCVIHEIFIQQNSKSARFLGKTASKERKLCRHWHHPRNFYPAKFNFSLDPTAKYAKF